MKRSLSVAVEHYPIAGSFTISRGARTVATVVTCTIREGDLAGRGECVPYARYGETPESVEAAIRAMAPAIAAGADRATLLKTMPAGAARNAVDCALWDLDLKTGRASRADLVPGGTARPLTTAFTISLGDPERMAADVARAAGWPLLKIKLGKPGDEERMTAVAEAARGSHLIADANEGWSAATVERLLDHAARTGFELVEQPLPAGEDALLARIARPVRVCADESVHGPDDLARLAGRYDAVNIKLDKTGGLTGALHMRRKAREQGFAIMAGCMVGTSLAMAPAVLLAQDADYVDLDGPLLLARDRDPGLAYDNAILHPPDPALWG